MDMLEKIFLFCAFICWSNSYAFAQEDNYDVNIGIASPEAVEGLSNDGITYLKHKIEQIATINGVATFSDGTFVLNPTLDVTDVRQVEGGMKTIFVVKAELVLAVVQALSDMRVASVSTTLSGSGNSLAEALKRAITSIDAKSSVYSNFLSESKKRICAFYDANYPKLLNKAKVLAGQQQYEQALSLLACYPASLPSYTKVIPVMLEIYKQYQNLQCSQLIKQAKGCMALKDYPGAVEYLLQIDPESSCSSECAKLLETIRQQVDQEEREAIERKFKLINTFVDLEKYKVSSTANLEKHRIAAIKDIAKAYLLAHSTK